MPKPEIKQDAHVRAFAVGADAGPIAPKKKNSPKNARMQTRGRQARCAAQAAPDVGIDGHWDPSRKYDAAAVASVSSDSPPIPSSNDDLCASHRLRLHGNLPRWRPSGGDRARGAGDGRQPRRHRSGPLGGRARRAVADGARGGRARDVEPRSPATTRARRGRKRAHGGVRRVRGPRDGRPEREWCRAAAKSGSTHEVCVPRHARQRPGLVHGDRHAGSASTFRGRARRDRGRLSAQGRRDGVTRSRAPASRGVVLCGKPVKTRDGVTGGPRDRQSRGQVGVHRRPTTTPSAAARIRDRLAEARWAWPNAIRTAPGHVQLRTHALRWVRSRSRGPQSNDRGDWADAPGGGVLGGFSFFFLFVFFLGRWPRVRGPDRGVRPKFRTVNDTRPRSAGRQNVSAQGAMRKTRWLPRRALQRGAGALWPERAGVASFTGFLKRRAGARIA